MLESDNKFWYSFGVSFKKAQISVREIFSLSEQEVLNYYNHIFPKANCNGFVVNTCNRTTFFLHGEKPQEVEKHFASKFDGDFFDVGYRYKNERALLHFFEVAAGMDSQIVGDFEIIGQMRKAFAFGKNQGSTDGIIEKLMNNAVHASRRIKNETFFSAGTSSVSFAAVHFLKSYLNNFESDKILILGTGEIGKRTIDNLVDFKGAKNIYISNRTPEKAERLAKKFGIQSIPWDQWKEHLSDCKGIVSAASVREPLLNQQDLDKYGSPEIILDLGMPPTINPNIHSVKLFNIDQISSFINTNMQRRNDALPQVRMIISEELEKHLEWETAHEATPVIKDCHDVLADRWSSKNKERVDRITHKIENRLFNEVRKNPDRVQEIERWLKKVAV